MRSRQTRFLVFLASAILAGCNAPVGGLFPKITGPSEAVPTDGDPQLIGTPTPFIPLNPTRAGSEVEQTSPTMTPTITPTPTPDEPWGDFPGPAQESPIEIPPPVEEITFPEGTVNLLLLGSDEAPHRYGHRTDTIMILSLHPAQNRASLVSVPRDLYVYVPGWRMDRINVADIFGGDNMVHDTILYNLGVDIDHWVRINFTGFQTAVDLVGGIEVEVGRSLSDDCGGTHYVYSPGTYHMDGFTALCYVRMRKTSSDFDRLRRQQEVIRALFRKVVSLDGIARLPQLYEQFNTYVDGDIGVGDLLPLAPLASEIASGKAEFEAARIDQSLVTPWRVPGSGAAVLLPNRQMIQEMLQNVLGAE